MKKKINEHYPLVSVILTVYNKAEFLPSTIASLLNQTFFDQLEIIFVDDMSSDHSCAIIQEYCDQYSNISFIRNQSNQGPSIRLNQGAFAAKGEYLLLMDGDDVLYHDAAQKMLELIQKFEVDLIYGKRRKLSLDDHYQQIGTLDFDITDQPLHYILSHRKMVNVALMVKKEVFIKSGGADPTIFIQDESLPLRLGYAAKSMIDLKTPIVGIIPTDDNNQYKRLAKDDNQQFHDRFFAYYNFINAHPALEKKLQKLLLQRAISTSWKYLKRNKLTSFISKYFLEYCIAKFTPSYIQFNWLEKHAEMFGRVKNIRKVTDS